MRRPRAGSQQMLLEAGNIAPTLVTYTTAGSFTETAPGGAMNVVIECWGGSGGGGNGTGSGCAAQPGVKGATGGYSRTSLAIPGGGTFNYTVGAAGVANGGAAGGASSVSSGSISITTLTDGGGTSATGSSTPGTGGTASGGTAQNTTGNASGTAIVGVNATGPAGGLGGAMGAGHSGSNGSPGQVCFYYT